MRNFVRTFLATLILAATAESWLSCSVFADDGVDSARKPDILLIVADDK